MSETASAGGPEAKAPAAAILGVPRNPVTRYRRQVVAAIAVTVLVVFVIALMIGFRPPKPVAKGPSDPDKTATSGASLAGPDFGTLPKTYGDPNGPIGQAPATTSLPGAEGASPSGAAAGAAPAKAPPSPDQQQAIDMARTARTASPFFPHGADGGPTATAAANPQGGSSPGYALPIPGSIPTTGPTGQRAGEPMLPASAVQNMQDQKRAFVEGTGQKTDYVPDAYRHPVSPFELKAGSIIPAALITALNSDLPGEIIAQVTEGVYDHATGRTLLIPQGARLVGQYDSQVAYGQNRALIVWNRIILPDGRSIDLGVMTGADLSGASGLADQVDSHISPMMRAIALSTAITVGGAVAQNSAARSSGNLVLNDAAGGVSSQASQVGQRFVDRELNRQPTIKVRPGWPLTVLVSKDLVLEPY
jgi:type IV secretory pathway VirB10-like protein